MIRESYQAHYLFKLIASEQNLTNKKPTNQITNGIVFLYVCKMRVKLNLPLTKK
jgi:hypothetical protein